MKTFRIIYEARNLKYKIQRRLLWGLIWYEVEEPPECDIHGYDYARSTMYFNRVKEAEDYIHTNFTKGKEFIVKAMILK